MFIAYVLLGRCGGMQYKGTKLGYSLFPEHRAPTVANRMPRNIPFVCKHIYLVLQLYPFWSKSLASKFKKYYQDKVESESHIQNIQRVRMNRANRDYVPLTNPNPGVNQAEQSPIQEATQNNSIQEQSPVQ